MDSPCPVKYPDRDGLPLSALSPQRVNGRVAKPVNNTTFSLSSPIRKQNDQSNPPTFFSPGLQLSPSLPEFTAIRERFLPPTDVSGLVKRFEHLDVRDKDAESLERTRKYDEALDRAKIAREEAEDEARRYREELRAQRRELEESKDRERRACKRIDMLMDEFARAKEQWSSQSGVYEKEIRRARKEAFKSSSAVLKLHEEHKHTTSELRGTKVKLDLVQRKAITSDEDKFAAQYQLVAVQEELEKLQATLRIAQEEREALKKSLRDDEIAEIAAQGLIALPAVDDEVAVAALPMRDVSHMKLKDLEQDLHQERQRRRAAQDLVSFMRLECRFNCCTCAAPRQRSSPPRQSESRPDGRARSLTPIQPSSVQARPITPQAESPEPIIQQEQTRPHEDTSDTAYHDVVMQQRLQTPEPERETPSQHDSLRMVTKTTKVPINFSPVKKIEATPIVESTSPVKTYAFDREAALAAIAYRRDRARSFAQSNATPNKSIDGIKDRRDMSAPVITG